MFGKFDGRRVATLETFADTQLTVLALHVVFENERGRQVTEL